MYVTVHTNQSKACHELFAILIGACPYSECVYKCGHGKCIVAMVTVNRPSVDVTALSNSVFYTEHQCVLTSPWQPYST